MSLLCMQSCCYDDDKYLYLPNGGKEPNQSILNFSNSYDVSFVENYGFCGEFQDTLLNAYLLKFHGDEVLFYDNIDSTKIEKLTHKRILYLRFEKIIDIDKYNIHNLSTYIAEKYENVSINLVSSTCCYIEKGGCKIVKIEFNTTGLPGYFIYILPVN